MGHSAHVTRVRWAFDDSKLISIGGNDTAVMIWDNSFVTPTAEQLPAIKARNLSLQSDIVSKNRRKGESEDSDTDSEDEGYDSDVRREQKIDYSKSIFQVPIKRPEPDVLKNMYENARAIDKK